MNIFKTLNQKGQHNWIKILCLGIGLATGIVLIGKAGFEQSWDNFFSTSDRIFVVYEDVIRKGEYVHYSQTPGGQWIFVLDKSGSKAYRRNIRIGRQNPQYYEVLEGLEPGERVVTSGYEAFKDNEVLVIK